MLRRDVLKVLGSIPLTTFTPIFAKTHMGTTLYFSCSENNDLYRLATSSGISCIRFQNAREAVNHIPTGSVLLILAEDYPTKATQIDPDIYQEAAQKRLRLYVEFPSSLPSGSVGEPQRVALGKYNNVLERVVIASSSIAPVLERLHVLSLHECYY